MTYYKALRTQMLSLDIVEEHTVVIEYLVHASSYIRYLLGKVTKFHGCFPPNQLLPFPDTVPISMINNTNHSTGPGIHCVALLLLADESQYAAVYHWTSKYISKIMILKYFFTHFESP